MSGSDNIALRSLVIYRYTFNMNYRISEAVACMSTRSISLTGLHVQIAVNNTCNFTNYGGHE